jgi:hypothetical protein
VKAKPSNPYGSVLPLAALLLYAAIEACVFKQGSDSHVDTAACLHCCRELLELGPEKWTHKQIMWGRVWWKEVCGFTRDLSGVSSEVKVTHNEGSECKTPMLLLRTGASG